MFSIESLALAGETYANSGHVRRACDFILGKQMEDGGWGESFKASLLAGPFSTALGLEAVWTRAGG